MAEDMPGSLPAFYLTYESDTEPLPNVPNNILLEPLFQVACQCSIPLSLSRPEVLILFICICMGRVVGIGWRQLSIIM